MSPKLNSIFRRAAAMSALLLLAGTAVADRRGDDHDEGRGHGHERREDDRDHDRRERYLAPAPAYAPPAQQPYYPAPAQRYAEPAPAYPAPARTYPAPGAQPYPAPSFQLRGVPPPAPGYVTVTPGRYFEERQRVRVYEYYGEQYDGKHCPPGMKKKHHGCVPHGHERRMWGVGQPLPREAVYYPVEPMIQTRLGPPPAGHQFIRVAGDILLIAVGTGLVIDAIEDIGER